MNENLWIGAYSLEQNAYCIREMDSLCEHNQRIFRKGFAGYTPLCYGTSREEVSKELDKIKEKRKHLFSEFADMMVEVISASVEAGTDVHVEHEEDTGIGDAFVKDGITVIPEEHKDGPFPIVGLMGFYRDFFSSQNRYPNMDAAARGTAQEILDIIMEMWEDPQPCPYCAEEAE